MNRIQKYFKRIHGIDISENNIEHARKYLIENGVDSSRFKLFLSNGSDSRTQNEEKYDFIYSTIVIQHIAVHTIRMNIIKDMYHMLKDDSMICLQFGYGWDNGTYWADNYFAANSTKGGHDFSVPDQQHVESIRADMQKIGFKKVEFYYYESPHPHLKDYHPQWLFMSLSK